MMNLLVTGGAGFIGTNVILRVIERSEVRRLVNLDCLTYAGHAENLADVKHHRKYVFERADIRDIADVLRIMKSHAITHVLHLAAESHVDRSLSCPGDFIQTNVVGTFNLLEACRQVWGDGTTGHRFHHVSTDEVYGSLGPAGLFTESSPYAPNSPYAASKAASDLLVRAYHASYGLPTLITHCSNNYGPYQYPEKLIPVVIQRVLAGQPIPVYGDGLNVRDWIYVLDHADALWRVLTQGRVGQVYNIGASSEWANIGIVERICDLCDELAPQLGGQSRHLISFVRDRPGHDRRYAIDASKLERELGWRPQHTFERGIRETVAWYLEHPAWTKRIQQAVGAEASSDRHAQRDHSR